MKQFQNPIKEERHEGEKGVQWLPQYAGHRGAIRGPDDKTRKDAQRNVRQHKESNGNVDSDGYLRVDCMKNYHEAGKKQVNGEVKERRSYLDCAAHLVRAEEQK
jgi:hypothetical protein